MTSNSDVISIDTQWQASQLINVFLLPHDHGFALVETGPQKTIELVWAKLQKWLTPARPLTDILVTHIHLDHSGGAAWLQAQTGAVIHVHERGAKHLLDPQKIIAGSKAVFGVAFDLLWQAPLPATGQVRACCDGDKVMLPGRSLTMLDTPGHAWHHAVWLDEANELAFCGDVAGVRFAGPQSLRLPTVPADFSAEDWQRSLAKLKALRIERLALTHGGIVKQASEHLQAAQALLTATMALFTSQLTPDQVDAAFRQLLNERLAAEANAEELAKKYEMIAATPMCIQGIRMALAKAAK